MSLTNKTVILPVMCVLHTYVMSDNLNEIQQISKKGGFLLVVLYIAFIGFFLDFRFNINSLWKLIASKRNKGGKRQ